MSVITGKIVSLTDGKLVFESDVAGKITVELSNIQTISSDEPVLVHLKDRTGFNQRLISAQAGKFAIQGTESISRQEFSIVDIVSINPPAKPAPKWTGDISLGITSTHGNTKSESITGSATASKRTEKDRTTLSADYAKSKKDDDVTGEEENAFPAETTNDQTGTSLWVNVMLGSPVVLAPNTEYGFDLTSLSGADEVMFFETDGIRDDIDGGNPYADGTAYVTGADGVADNTMTVAPGDHVFVVELEAL